MKTIVIGDIHGCYNELNELITSLKENGEYNKDTDKLVFLGDYIDRGKDSRKVIELIRSLQKENKNVIALMGNHEDMLINYYGDRDDSWMFNGCNETLKSYEGFNKQFWDDVAWMKQLPLYHEDENFIYVHAGIDIDKPMSKQDRHTLLWVRDDFIYDVRQYNKRVVFGHTPTYFLDAEDMPVITFGNNIAIDTGCVYNGKLTALVIENGVADSFYQVKKDAVKVAQ